MKIKSFTYTKTDGSTSERVLLVMSEPYKFVTGVDISELNDEDQAMFAISMGAAHDAYLQRMIEIQDKYDVVHNFRQFDPVKMTNVKQEHV